MDTISMLNFCSKQVSFLFELWDSLVMFHLKLNIRCISIYTQREDSGGKSKKVLRGQTDI